MLSFFRGRRLRLVIVILAAISSLTTLFFSLQESATTNINGFNFELAAKSDPPPDPDSYPYGALVIAARSDTDLEWTMFTKSK